MIISFALPAPAVAYNGQNSNIMKERGLLKINQFVGVRYIVHDVDTAVNFYTETLGFHIDQHVKSAFAALSVGNLNLFINQPGAGGAGQAMHDGTIPTPGGWNRIQFMVEDLQKVVNDLKSKG